LRGTASSISIAALHFIPVATALAQTADKIGTARTDAIRRLDLQTEFPKVKPPPEPINWGHWNFTIPPELLWILLAGLIVVAIWMLWEPLTGLRLPQRAKRRPETSSESTEGEEAAAEPGLAASAEALARAGRYAEAIHELLMQSLAEIRAGLQEQFADSLTSREILRSTRLAPEGRRALSDIIRRVELSHFGQREVGEADYLVCRRSFDELGAALAGAAAA
jgi:hypothetical protein